MVNRATFEWARRLSQPQRRRVKSASLPAPVRGINAVGGLMQMDPLDAIYLYNLTPSEYGCRVRDGYIEHANASGGSGLSEIRSLLPYSSASGTTKLFAVTSAGVYDITNSTTNPTKVVDYGGIGGWVTTGDAGYCSHQQFVNAAGSFLLVCDEENGYFYYDGTTWTTAPVLSAGITDPKVVSFVKVWKNRVWLVREDTGSAYYLATGAISGANTEFQFGNKFPHGGYLKGLYSYTRDGGAGIDDFLVAISSTGDVLVYQGYDPAAVATFELRGSWFVGDMPAGSRIATDLGSDLAILSAYGVLSVSKLLSGASIASPDFYITYKVARLVRDIMDSARASRGWELTVHAKSGLLILSTPKRDTTDHIQFVADINTGAWGIWRGVPSHCMTIWQNNLYLGTKITGTANKIYYMDGNLDGLLLGGTSQGQVAFSGLTSFQNGEESNWTRIQFIQPRFLAEQAPSYLAEARYDFNNDEISDTPSSPPSTSGNVWDTGTWDSAVWEATEEFSPFESHIGGSGMGRHSAIAFKGATASDTILVGFDIIYDEGGLL